MPVIAADGSSSGGDSTLLGDAAVPSEASSLDAPPDVTPDQGSPNGIRCGPVASEIFCNPPSPTCCLVFDDAGAGSFSCQASETACSGYPIVCASDNDCPGTQVCCFYHSGLKCSADNDPNCTTLVCDPDGSADQCPTGQSCNTAYIDAGLPYHVCT